MCVCLCVSVCVCARACVFRKRVEKIAKRTSNDCCCYSLFSPQSSAPRWQCLNHTRIDTHAQTHRHTDTQTHRHTRTHTHTRTDTDRHTHTNTQPDSSARPPLLPALAPLPFSQANQRACVRAFPDERQIEAGRDQLFTFDAVYDAGDTQVCLTVTPSSRIDRQPLPLRETGTYTSSHSHTDA